MTSIEVRFAPPRISIVIGVGHRKMQGKRLGKIIGNGFFLGPVLLSILRSVFSYDSPKYNVPFTVYGSYFRFSIPCSLFRPSLFTVHCSPSAYNSL